MWRHFCPMTGGSRACDDKASRVDLSVPELLITWGTSCLQMPNESSIAPAETIVLSTTMVVLLEYWRWRIISERQERIRICALSYDLRDISDGKNITGSRPQATAPQLGSEFSR